MSSVAASAGQPERTRRSPAWRRILLGPDEKMQLGISMCLLACSLYLLWFLIVGLVFLPHGLASPQLCLLYMSQELAACLVFYPLVRSGLTRRWSDPLLVMPQMLWANTGLIAGYVASDQVRPVMLQTLCLVQVFGFLSLKPRAARFMGVATIVMLLAMLPLAAAFGAPAFVLTDEILRIAATCFVIGLLTLQSAGFARLRERVLRDRRELRRTLEELRRISMHDALTGLLNRQAMQERIEDERERARRTGSGFCVALLDLDHFKRVNDGHGHQTGDEVLAGFARAACATLRETDVLARWGGEEFVVLMPDTSPGPAGLVGLHRLRAHLAERSLSEAVPALRTTFSAGMAASHPGESLAQLMERADQALYAAKEQGRDRVVVAPES
ncbi:MAG: GGDEF domain-containing protein [Aquabacterium sp.]|nr:MAG: GGDEF domain-containing protein [Aquabacterium sp.]